MSHVICSFGKVKATLFEGTSPSSEKQLFKVDPYP